MDKRKKVNINVNHPDFQCDVTMPEGKALKFLESIKKSLKENIKVVTKTI